MKSQKSHNRQVAYHTYSTFIYELATKQIGIKNLSKRHKQPQNQENYTKSEKFSPKYMQKWYITPLTPKSDNVLIGSRGDTTKNKNTKTQNKEN